MSSPTNGSWNDNPENSGPNPQYPGYNQGGGFGQSQGQGQPQSIGQGFEQQGGFGQPAGAPRPSEGQQDQTSIGQDFGRQGGYDQGQQGSYDQGHQGYGQPQQQGGFGQQASGSAGAAVQGAGDGIGDLFSDFQFKKGLTEKIASLAFLLTVVWAVLKFVRTLAHAWGSQGNGEFKVKNMGGFEAFMTTLEALASLVLTVAIIRIVLELAVNVARIAKARARD